MTMIARSELPLTKRTLYISSLACYNNGQIYGRWINASTDADAMRATINALLANAPIAGDEYAIHTFEGYPESVIGEYTTLETIATIETLLTSDDYDPLLVLSVLSEKCGDAEHTQRMLDDRYLGYWPSIEHFAEDRWSDLLALTPEFVRPHVDLESMVRGELLSGTLDHYVIIVDNEEQHHFFVN